MANTPAHLGHIFPQLHIGVDPGAVRAYVQGVEQLGFEYIMIADHVMAADPASWQASGRGTPREDEAYREPLITLSFIAAWTRTLGIGTSILLLPQRPTALVAKQVAELDLLSEGRVRLGVGVGRIPLEYEALGQDFPSRGRRIEEQIALLRKLWTEDFVDFEGKFHKVKGGVKPMPVQRPIPIWMGGGIGLGGIVDPVLRRVARIADGWCPLPAKPEDEDLTWGRMKQYLAEYGRDPNTFPYEVRTNSYKGTEEEWQAGAAKQAGRGVTHYTVDNRGASFRGVDQHLESLGRWMKAVKG